MTGFPDGCRLKQQVQPRLKQARNQFEPEFQHRLADFQQKPTLPLGVAGIVVAVRHAPSKPQPHARRSYNCRSSLELGARYQYCCVASTSLIGTVN